MLYQRKTAQKDVFEILPNALAKLRKNIRVSFLGGDWNSRYEKERPLQSAELFTDEQLENYAKTLAKTHAAVYEQPSEHLLKRLAENEAVLLEVHELLTASAKGNKRIVPAGEWLLDNFYLIEEQIYTGKKHLPKGYSKALPGLLKGHSAGLPRVYDIAVEIFSHTDGLINLKSLTGFIRSYQTITTLKLGELWAIPIMLRLALIENLRRISIQIAIDIRNKNLAEDWADKLTETALKDSKSLVLVIADMVRSEPPMVSSFVAELTRRLQEKGSLLTLPLNWIEQRLSENGSTSSELIHQENQKQASDQVSISNSIHSLRFLGTTDWRDFIETTSIIEHILRQDIDGVYGKMDFYTRDTYRHVIERLAKKSELPEQQIATLVIDKAKAATEINENDFRGAHVGYYLVGKGLRGIEKQIRLQLQLTDIVKKIFNKKPLLFYAGVILLLTLFISGGFIAKAFADGLHNWLQLILLGIVAAIASSQFAVTLINWLSTVLAMPRLLPRMDFSKEIPADCGTLILIPAMLTSMQEIDELVEDLEIRFLANKHNHLHFALLTDFKDAASEKMEADTELIKSVTEKIIALNKKYDSDNNALFFLFHRPRRWNAGEKTWMGYERKRGKLGELNALLRRKGKEKFSVIIGDSQIFETIKYIITLDADTQLPRDAAWKMIATIAHPLNKAVYSTKKQRVVDGYTILQPKVANSLHPANASLYARMYQHEAGTDPYTRAVSDVYQDLFQEGSFIGKGIYDIDAFELALSGKFPDNRILSHDLLEGCYSRSGLISDVLLYEANPSRYLADMKRRHRWIRGDWQIAGWLSFYVPASKRYFFKKNPLSALSRWKIFDNIRRSLVPLSLLLLLLFGWLFSVAAWFWTFAVTAIIMLPSFISFCWELINKPKEEVLMQHILFSLKSAGNHFFQHLLQFVCLPYEVYLNLDAIIRTNWRMMISQKKLLEWNPSINNVKKQHASIFEIFRSMWASPLLAAALLVYLSLCSMITFVIAAPVLILWILSPFIAWQISIPYSNSKPELSEDQKNDLKRLSRKIWGFFENFVVEDDNWLPPDNYQEEPIERIAHRTSPTNIGLSLLSNLTAFNFGYIAADGLINRTQNTISTLLQMERYKGHLYNWYDTQSLLPLNPRYVSTVDSGNLSGHLIVLKQGLLTLPGKKIISEKTFEGLLDTIRVLSEKIKENSALKQYEKELERLCITKPLGAHGIKVSIDNLATSFGQLFISLNLNEENEYYWWAANYLKQVQAITKSLNDYVPWVSLPNHFTKFSSVTDLLIEIPTLQQLSEMEVEILPLINNFFTTDNSAEENDWLTLLSVNIAASCKRAKKLLLITEQLVQDCEDLADVEYDFLYDKTQHLLSIGYNVDEHRRDHSFYDLLASEARLSTFVGIAQDKLPQDSWFALGRQVTNLGNTPILLSWSGSMFEYLMPLLVMPTYENTLLDETIKAIVLKQIEYGEKQDVPWGISESGYNMVDAHLNYQYRAFGVPGTGFKRGLGEDLVISPYATVMALMVDQKKAYLNLGKLAASGTEGKFGFYEAVDYTVSRLPRGQNNAIIKSFMAHHLGMSFLSLAYVLLDQPMQKLFEAEIKFKATLLLLQEKIPRISTFYSPSVHIADSSVVPPIDETPIRIINTPDTDIPEVHLLSNGRYHTMITNAGGGYSRWKDIAVTRWREDSTCDDWGTFCYIRDMDSNSIWSSAYQPILKQGENYEAVFSEGKAEFRRRDFSLETHTEIVVSPEDDIELRRLHITNRSRKRRNIEVTSYAEVVLASAISDELHPAFSNLFVQTEIIPQRHSIVCTRRPRSVEEHLPTMFHLMKAYNAEVLDISYETDRSQFIGRGNTIHDPVAMKQPGSLSNTQGSVLDPIIAIRYRIVIEPFEKASVDLIIGIGETKDACNVLIEKYQDENLTNRVFKIAWTHSQVILRQINAAEADAQLYCRLAGSVIFSNASLRSDPAVIIKNHRGQSALWSYSISGDLPIVLVQIEDAENIELVKQLVQAHAYWRLKGLVVDLVIWNEDRGGYRQLLQNQIIGFVAPDFATDVKEHPGGIFIRSADQISNEDRILFQTVAHIVLSDTLGTLEEQINRRNKLKGGIPYLNPANNYFAELTNVALYSDLQFFNGTGGFSKDGKEYIITTSPLQRTPAPWINVLANPNFGSIISESGQSYTWIQNAHELRLTPWNNDPVSDLRGEAFYIRDEESGKFWSPAPLPCRSISNYITRHGFGYSIFEHNEDGIYSNMCVYVDMESSIKFIRVRLSNHSNRKRQLSATGYIEWVLGDLRKKTIMHVVTEMDTSSGAIFAKNTYNKELENRVAFFDVDELNKTFTTDRKEFIGRNGTMANPDAMSRSRLSGKTGAALDPCAAIQVAFNLAEEEEREIIFRLGIGHDANDASIMARQFKGSAAAVSSLENVKNYWQKILGRVQINTPDAAVNIIANGWLNYQTLASRIWARSGFYQSGGAFGFRDQLQDVLSLLHIQPQLARTQILLCASRQFKEGDVQHWWHPPTGRGVRTTCSDDFLWLPFVTSRYIKNTGDIAILNESVNFLEGRALNTAEESYYDLPIKSDITASLYLHCVKAIEHGLRFGAHGLPLMGSGDWNDGMDKVGMHGKGESVWLAFFLYDILHRFVEVARLKNDLLFAEKCQQQANELYNNIQKNTWDGDWYRRAYFDDGTPLGSAANDECKIDSIAQSWSVLSKGSNYQRSEIAMASADKYLVRKGDNIIQLFNPPFDKSEMNPGYIKGYVPGVRENGGQYTHAAIWFVMAFAALGDKKRTWDLLKMINPINHGSNAEKIAVYKSEPYVMPADIYAEPLHKGCGGWTWYTGSAGWMYQLMLESFIGIGKVGNTLLFKPCIPAEWTSVKMVYWYLDTVYHITYQQEENTAMKILLDHIEQKENVLPLINDGQEHLVSIVF